MQRPLHTYSQNVEGTRIVLEAMQAADVANIVFSSSAAVYGTPDVPLVTEDLPKRPASPYGESKLIGEWLLRDQATATAESEHPLRHTSLRYFNVVGSGDPSVYDTSPHNLFPLVFEALLEGRTPRINGDDYDTPDGTNVRDYVHVGDIAAAHVVAAQRLAAGEPIEPAYNLGSQNGLSVREIMDAMARVTGIDFTPEIGPRRPGDPDRIVATGELAARDLDWANRYSVDEMVRTGWEARRRRPSWRAASRVRTRDASRPDRHVPVPTGARAARRRVGAIVGQPESRDRPLSQPTGCRAQALETGTRGDACGALQRSAERAGALAR